MPAKPVHDYDPATTDDLDVKFEHLEATGRDSATFRVWTREDPRREWRVEVTEDDVEVLSSKRGDQLVTLAAPDWLEDWAATVRHNRR